MARFFLPRAAIDGRRGTIVGAELDHLRKVLRLRPGDAVTVFDESGWEHEAVLRSVDAQRAEIEIHNSAPAESESPLEITLGLALTKGDKMDFVIEKATELGVQTIAPLVTRFTVPNLDEKRSARRAERWQKIALSATKQCGRTRVPEIRPLMDFPGFVREPGAAELKIFFWEKEKQRTLHELRQSKAAVRAIILIVGPEGGFDETESATALEQGFIGIGLGRRILRAETAAVITLGLVQFLWGDLG